MRIEEEDKVVWGFLGLAVLVVIGMLVLALTAPDNGTPAKVCPVIGGVAICSEE